MAWECMGVVACTLRFRVREVQVLAPSTTDGPYRPRAVFRFNCLPVWTILSEVDQVLTYLLSPSLPSKHGSNRDGRKNRFRCQFAVWLCASDHGRAGFCDQPACAYQPAYFLPANCRYGGAQGRREGKREKRKRKNACRWANVLYMCSVKSKRALACWAYRPRKRARTAVGMEGRPSE